MKILLAPDKFKGTASSAEVIRALSHGMMSENTKLEITGLPMADGGDGSLDVLKLYHKVTERTLQVRGPYYNPVFATYLLNEEVAYIEMAKASGIALVDKNELHTIRATSYGTGELILDAIQQGVSEIVLFVGGSATTDAGIGMASALGYCFYDEKDKHLEAIGANLDKIRIIQPPLDRAWKDIRFKVVCDVSNPMFGPQGAAYVYGPQKGATSEELELLDKGLQNLHCLILEQFERDINVEGAGAAGALAGGATFFMDAQLIKGIDLFMDISSLAECIRNADVVITGEGRIDTSSMHGKVISGVIPLALDNGKKVILVCGQAYNGVALPANVQLKQVLDKAQNIQDAMTNWKTYLVDIGREIAKNLHSI